MPDVSGAEYMVAYFNEVGKCGKDEGLAWAELESWSRMTGTPLDAWELMTLHDMSGAYWGQLQLSKDPDCEDPWLKPLHKIDRVAISAGIKEVFRQARLEQLENKR